MTNEQHNKYIAWAFLGHAAFQMLMLVFMAAMFSVFFFIDPPSGQPPFPRAMFAVMIGFFSVFYLFFTLPSVIAAYALFKKKSWARVASITAGVIAAMNVPIGTAACVYALWFFIGENWKEIYPQNQINPSSQQLAAEREAQWTGYRQSERGGITFQKVEPPDWR